ncbi:FAD-dependent oxidoreductase [Streptomyces sp. NBC_01565]|uniref:NAD(P)/FAD-dependent oxidoreductase n=1 Tax=unclassified Streptomyces TaxID=2593676 RepID=UPI0022503AD5|nr:FAD-dependent oxidoreductase [Streptomyces sp. NBC_01565]MCX4539397.1 FAD-binding oxidoreductase [Streptomyces sp. NBC_01565]
MKILLTLPAPGLATTDFLRSGNLVHDPAADSVSDDRLLDALILHGATALITTHRPDDTLLRVWAQHTGGPVHVAYAAPAGGGGAGAADGLPSRLHRPAEPVRPIHPVHPVHPVHEFPLDGTGLDAIAVALAHCERAAALARPVPAGAAPEAGGPGDVFLIGAGVVNLVTALYLADRGYRLTVVDRSPVPGTADWEAYGCTHAGDDARMFTFTEMDNYGNQDFRGSAPDWFRQPVEKHGWLARDPATLTAHEHAWIDEFESIPSWLARAYNADIFSLSAESGAEWGTLRARFPRLFEDVVLTEDILRVYSDPAHLRASLARHRAIGAVLRELSATELAREHPALAASARGGTLVGGLLVPGFTVNVHKFTERAVALLTELGARFHWNTPVTGVRRDPDGAVTGFDCAVPVPEDAHVVASPGVDGAELLRGTPCEGRVHGVLGGWMRVENRAPALRHSLKVARRGHVTEDANVTVARDGDGREVLIVGSGYGYTGAAGHAGEPEERQLAAMRAGIADTIERLFPHGDEPAASSLPYDNYGFKYCVRPWTATSLGLYHAERLGPGGGLYVVTGGHNTGGFAQSPAIARAVLASLRGESHAMHTLYHPERYRAFADGTSPHATPAPLPLASRT